MWVQSTCASSATSASTSTDMWRTDGYLMRFEPCVLPKMSLFPCHHVVSDCVCVQRTLWFQTPFYCYCAHECATHQKHKVSTPTVPSQRRSTHLEPNFHILWSDCTLFGLLLSALGHAQITTNATSRMFSKDVCGNLPNMTLISRIDKSLGCAAMPVQALCPC